MPRPQDLTCNFADIDRLSFICQLPSPGFLEWFASMSGFLSTGAAIWFGVWSIRHANTERLRAEDAERRVRLSQISDKIIDAFSKISESEFVQGKDLPWLITHFQALDHALAPFGKVAEEFYEEVSTLAREISSFVDNLFLSEAESEWKRPEQIELTLFPGIRLRIAVGILRSGLNAFTYAENDDARKLALENFQKAKEQTSLAQ